MRSVFDNFNGHTVGLTHGLLAYRRSGQRNALASKFLATILFFLAFNAVFLQVLHAHVVCVGQYQQNRHVRRNTTRSWRWPQRYWACPQPITRAKTHGKTSDVQSASRTIHSNGMLRIAVLRNGFLKTRHHRSLSEKVRAQHFHYRINVGLGDILATVESCVKKLTDRTCVSVNQARKSSLLIKTGWNHSHTRNLLGPSRHFLYALVIGPAVDLRQNLEVLGVFIGEVGIFRANHLLMQLLARANADNLLFGIRCNHAQHR